MFAGFKGGKGISPGWAALVVLSPIAGVVTLIGLAIAVLTRYVSLGSMIGASLGVGVLIVLSIVDVPIALVDSPIEYLALRRASSGAHPLQPSREYDAAAKRHREPVRH